MTGKVYQIMELVGTSKKGIEEAINNAVDQAAKTNYKVDWFEVMETRGFVDEQKVKYYQVRVKIGCNI